MMMRGLVLVIGFAVAVFVTQVRQPVAAVAGSGTATTRPVLQFTVRVDDVFNRGHPARPRSISELLFVAEKHRCRVILNVIPRRLIESPNEGGAMVAELRSAIDRGHEIIQHGYDHCCSQCGDTGHQTYCPLLSREQPIEGMLRDIRLGKEMLEAAIGRRIYCYGPTGVDLHTVQLLTVVKQLGYPATTGEPTPEHERLGLKVVPTGEDYAFGAATPAEYDAAMKDLKTEFDQVVRQTVTSGKTGYFQILLHDPFTRASYQNGATLKYLDTMLTYMESKNEVELRNILSRDFLGLTEEDLRLPEPKYPELYKQAKELNRLKGELVTTRPAK